MGLPTAVSQELNDALRATPELKAADLISRAKLIKDIAAYIFGEAPMRAYRLSQLQNSLYDHKAFIQSQNLVTVESRTVIAAAYPQYADAAAVGVDVQAANVAFIQLTKEIEKVLAGVRAAGLVDNDPVTGQVIQPEVPEADMVALRGFADTVKSQLG